MDLVYSEPLMVSQNSGTATLFLVVINHQHFLAVKVMNKLLPVSIGILLVLSNWSILPADAGRSRPSCNSALKFVRTLKGIRDNQLNPLGKQGQPAGRTKSFDLVFNNFDLVLKTETHLSIATRVIKNCSQVGSVSFTGYRTDGGAIYGLKNGRIVEFICLEDQSQLPRWGEDRCL